MGTRRASLATFMTSQTRGVFDEPSLKASDFIARNPIFRFETFVAAHTADGRSPATSAAILRYHVKTGRLHNMRRGLYASVGPLDPWVLGSRLTRDAIIAYDGALSFHKLAGLGHSISFATKERSKPFSWNEVVYSGIRPVYLPDDVEGCERSGQVLKVTSIECTLVDLLDRLDLAPEPLELYECFERSADRLRTTWCWKRRTSRANMHGCCELTGRSS